MHGGLPVEGRSHGRPVVIGRAAATERNPPVGGALPVDDHVTVVREGGASGQARIRPEVVGQGLGRHHQRVDGHELAPETGKRGRPGLGRPHDDLRPDGATGGGDRGATGSGAAGDGGDFGVLVNTHTAPLDRLGEATGQERRLQRGAVGREGGTDDPAGIAERTRLFRAEPAEVLLAEPERTRRVHLGQRPGLLRLASYQVDRPALREVAVDPFRRSRRAHNVDRRLHGPAHGDHGVVTVAPLQGGVGRGEQCGAPAAVPARRTEAGYLPFEHDDAQCRVRLSQRMGRPEAGEARAHNADVDSEVLGQGRAGRERGGHGLPPQGEALVPRGGASLAPGPGVATSGATPRRARRAASVP